MAGSTVTRPAVFLSQPAAIIVCYLLSTECVAVDSQNYNTILAGPDGRTDTTENLNTFKHNTDSPGLLTSLVGSLTAWLVIPKRVHQTIHQARAGTIYLQENQSKLQL